MHVVAIGGGHGLAMVLGALAGRVEQVTGVVSVADDGGSSGRLRRELGIVAPGDMRRCLGALTPPGLIRDALEHRFDTGTLEGHPAGNVLLASMLELCDDPVEVMDTLASMVGARGRVLPATCRRVDLIASAERGTVKGQVAISESGDIDSVRFSPDDPEVPSAVLQAVAEADAVVVGPGSLYTSVLAAVVPGIRAAIVESAATVIFVANLAAEPGETDGYGLVDHIEAVRQHGIDPDVVLADHRVVPATAEPVVRIAELAAPGAAVHDPGRLASAILDLLDPTSPGSDR